MGGIKKLMTFGLGLIMRAAGGGVSEIAKSMKTTKISKNDSVLSFPTWNSLCAGPKAWSFVGWAKSLVFCGLGQKSGVLVGWAQSLVFCGFP